MKYIIIFQKADSLSEHCGLSVYKLCQGFLLKKRFQSAPRPRANQYKSTVMDPRCLQFFKTYSGDCNPLLV